MSRIATALMLFAATGWLAACSSAPGKLPAQKIGKPYVINGKSYYPAYEPNYDKTGEASWYGPGFHGKYTASGEVYDQNDLTAAHPTLPMPSLVRVTNLQNGKSLIVRVNDRGPFKKNRIIDLSKKSAQALGIHSLARVRVQMLEQETQDYIAMVRQSGGEIIQMAEYNARAMDIQMARMQAAAPPPSVEEAAPVMTVASGDIASKEAPPVERKYAARPLQLVQPAAAEEITAEEVVEVPAPAAGEMNPPETIVVDPTPEAAPMPVATSAPAGDYTIQAGSFSSEGNARKLASKLETFGEVSVEQAEAGGKAWWRVRVGSFTDKPEAAYTLDQVRATGVKDARVVRK